MTAVAPPLETLPDKGRFIVDTEHSAYIIDMDARTFERWPAAPEASTLHGDGSALGIYSVLCVVGMPMHIEWRGGSGADCRITTPVASITATP